MQQTVEIPFKVSARAARLIGRENIANAKGAIIELVKNSYDADSRSAHVYFDNILSIFHTEFAPDHYLNLIKSGINKSLIDSLYKDEDDVFVLKDEVSEEVVADFKKAISKLASIYIIDLGAGMTQTIIRNHWMTIGTNNKLHNVLTKTGRVKAGAKGIGRFALDRLGSNCEMTTFFDPSYYESELISHDDQTLFKGYKWVVNWEDFNDESKTIENVGAFLTGLTTGDITTEIQSLKLLINDHYFIPSGNHKYGTVIKITNLRDNWEDYYVEEVFNDLEVLVPPKESSDFSINVNCSEYPYKYGEVLGSICDDYDYKLQAVADDNQNVVIKIYRNEYDIESIPAKFFDRDAMRVEGYKKSNFQAGYIEKTFTFSQLLPEFKNVDEDSTFQNIGKFNFSFYFLKRQTNSLDTKKFYYKNFMSNVRKDWLNKFGGIKLFRDHFRVRPYGETNSIAFDWLNLGNRKSASPAGISKSSGGYRVEPENVAGAIQISRLTNVEFDDKSSREGLQENNTFQVFKQLIISILNIFEEDRAYIARQLAAFENEIYGPDRDRKKAEELTKKIIAESKVKKENRAKKTIHPSTENEIDDSSQFTPEEADKIILASEVERQGEEIEKLKEEQRILRVLASSGIVLASFSHDLSKQSIIFDKRIDTLKKSILYKVKETDYLNVTEVESPFTLLDKIKKQDIKLQNWLNFSLSATKKDKRKRKQLYLIPYLSSLQKDWSSVFKERSIYMDISEVQDLNMRVFEIDFDSIFNNLIVNSIYAFRHLKVNRQRTITFKITSTSKEIIVDYHDTGPGLSKDIVDPQKIFEPMYTTRRNRRTGEEIGTGLGMWIVKSVVEENDGSVQLLYPEIGFGIRFTFPIKYKLNETN